jgi:hypothetical protein
LEGSFPFILNCTISANGAYGVETRTVLPLFTNCIVWGNGQASVTRVTDSPPAITYSCIEGDSTWPGPGNINQDPRFIQLGDYHLQPRSPAIDAGTSTGAPTIDIDGHRRPCGVGVDMGAYEFGDCGPPVRFKRGKVEGTGDIEITDVIVTFSYLFRGEVELSCLDAADSNDDGQLNIADPIYDLLFLYFSGSPPASPYPDCEVDPTIDELDCQEYQGCASGGGA